MEILRQGKTPEYVWCGYCICGCEFRLEKDDERYIEHDGHGNSYYKCPYCNRVLRLSLIHMFEV